MKQKLSGLGISRGNLWAIVIVLAVVVLYGLFAPTNYLICVGISIMTFAALGTAWNIIGGYAGQNCWCMASFMSMGCYASVLGYSNFHISPWIGMWVGVLVAVLLALLLGNIAFKHRGIYFTLMTTSLSEITRLCLIYFKDVTGGSGGAWVSFNRKNMGLKNLIFQSDETFYWIMLVVLALCVMASWRIKQSRLGYYLRAIGSDQDAAESLGLNIRRCKLLAFVFSAIMASIIGTFYAFYLTYIDPATVAATAVSTKMGSIAIVGGVGTICGPLIGSLVLIPLSEVANMLLGSSGAGMLLYGLALVLVITLRPGGIISFFQRDEQILANPVLRKLAQRKDKKNAGNYS